MRKWFPTDQVITVVLCAVRHKFHSYSDDENIQLILEMEKSGCVLNWLQRHMQLKNFSVVWEVES